MTQWSSNSHRLLKYREPEKMNTNPYDPTIGDLTPLPKPLRPTWVLILRRFLLWCSGFIVLFLINVLVEVFVLPRWGLEDTQRNDVYFLSWCGGVVSGRFLES